MGIIFIAVGTVFLLNNFGILSWMVWETLIDFWPVILIAAGFETLAGKNLILRMLANLIVLAGVGFIIVQIAMVDNQDFRNWVNKKYRWMPFYKNFFQREKPLDFKLRFNPGNFL